MGPDYNAFSDPGMDAALGSNRRDMQRRAMAGRDPNTYQTADQTARAPLQNEYAHGVLETAGQTMLAALPAYGAARAMMSAPVSPMNPLKNRTVAERAYNVARNADWVPPAVATPLAIGLVEGRNKFFGQQEMGIAPWNWNEPGTLQNQFRNIEDRAQARRERTERERYVHHANDGSLRGLYDSVRADLMPKSPASWPDSDQFVPRSGQWNKR